MADRITLFAQVLLPLPVPKTYTYRVPFEWNDTLQIGQRVAVQFGPRKIYAGIITDFHDTPPEKYQASYLLDILDDEPLITPLQLKFWNWVSEYYMCYPGEVMHAALPAGLRLQSESRLALHPGIELDELPELDEKENEIFSALLNNKTITLDDAARVIGLKSPMKYIKSLYQRGLIVMHEDLRESYRPKTETVLELSENWNSEEFAKTMLDQLESRAPKQSSVILAILGQPEQSIAKKELQEKYGIENSPIQSLIKKGLIVATTRAISRLRQNSKSAEFPELNPEQTIAANDVKDAFENGLNVLVHGVTGSGKTVVYLEMIRQVMSEGRQVLYLVPEVGLTEQLVSRLSVHFGDDIAVWHNYYSGAERTEIYQSVFNNKTKFLLGARSALFAPFRDLGLIVIDEEHESSFKQFDKRPHYHARDAAFQLAKLHNSRLLLGSATPSYEMLELCRAHKMKKVDLNHKYFGGPDPEIRLINVGEAKRQNRMKEIFSLQMLEEIEKNLRARSQVIVYQNRKGYVPYISCNYCGYTAHCINCDISLTYYKSLKTQKCNYCGYTSEPPSKCPACGSNAMNMKGFGTERISEELSIFFPEARIARFDQESVRKRSDFQRILHGFEKGDIDILVGTQLLSKGLDFSNIGLVCVPDADLLLNIPDFRSHERAFQQLHQVSGRAGRRLKQGLVLIQSYQTNHDLLEYVQHGDYSGLAEREFPQRKELHYPPFYRLIRITVRHKERDVAAAAANVLANTIRHRLSDRVLGPQEPVVARIRTYFLQQILVKLDPAHDHFQNIKLFLKDSADSLLKREGLASVRIDFDVDPV